MKIGQSIWLCKRLYETDEGIIVYDNPLEFKLAFRYLTVNGASGYLATMQYGEKINKVWTMKAIKSLFEGVFNEGDLLYVEGNKPNTEDKNYVNGDGANAIITSVIPYLVSYSITLERVEP